MIKFRAWFEESVLKKAHMVDWEELKEFKGLSRLFDDAPHSETFSLMQSTGLKDKNGVEIYVGDFVRNDKGEIGRVAYLKQEAGFVVVLPKSDYRLGHRNTGEPYDVASGHEVIGNIHANPELLSNS